MLNFVNLHSLLGAGVPLGKGTLAHACMNQPSNELNLRATHTSTLAHTPDCLTACYASSGSCDPKPREAPAHICRCPVFIHT